MTGREKCGLRSLTSLMERICERSFTGSMHETTLLYCTVLNRPVDLAVEVALHTDVASRLDSLGMKRNRI